MEKLTWSPENLRSVFEKILVKAQDPVAAKEYREALLVPERAKAEVAEHIEEPPGGWDSQFVAFQEEAISDADETINVFALPKGIGDTDFTTKRGCSYTRTY